ncbi:hypothetical protein RJ639_042824 [Escallonia herrerae]|uniref:RNA polymerase Rpb1 domain-containing protein n=1 Tax=Escallonia herrerae TaxID=1293975 RepID=A0AA88WDJ8_9ASTE|nr:hypothetical protein RJ639_042824 [Escallonia herrerae]
MAARAMRETRTRAQRDPAMHLPSILKAEVNKVFRYELDDEKWNPNYMLPKHVEDLKTIREFHNVFDAEVQKLEAYGFQLGNEIATTGDNSWPMPVNLKRLIWNAQKTFKVDLRRSSDMHLMEIVEAVDKLQERLKVVTGDDAMSMEAQKNATLFFNILLRSTFTSKKVLNEYRLTCEAFDRAQHPSLPSCSEIVKRLMVEATNSYRIDLKEATCYLRTVTLEKWISRFPKEDEKGKSRFVQSEQFAIMKWRVELEAFP